MLITTATVIATGASSAPLSARSVGLGCWADNRSCTGCPNITATLPWSLSAQSATDRICAVMNASAPEVSFWVLAGLAPSPQVFWWPALQRYRAGGGCARRSSEATPSSASEMESDAGAVSVSPVTRPTGWFGGADAATVAKTARKIIILVNFIASKR